MSKILISLISCENCSKKRFFLIKCISFCSELRVQVRSQAVYRVTLSSSCLSNVSEVGGIGREELNKWPPLTPAVLQIMNVCEKKTVIEKKNWNGCAVSIVLIFLNLKIIILKLYKPKWAWLVKFRNCLIINVIRKILRISGKNDSKNVNLKGLITYFMNQSNSMTATEFIWVKVAST